MLVLFIHTIEYDILCVIYVKWEIPYIIYYSQHGLKKILFTAFLRYFIVVIKLPEALGLW